MPIEQAARWSFFPCYFLTGLSFNPASEPQYPKVVGESHGPPKSVGVTLFEHPEL